MSVGVVKLFDCCSGIYLTNVVPRCPILLVSSHRFERQLARLQAVTLKGGAAVKEALVTSPSSAPEQSTRTSTR